MLTRVRPSLRENDAEMRGERDSAQLLSREQEQWLASQIRQGGAVGEMARKRFIEANQRLVFKIASQYKYAGRILDYNDLVQEGIIGLIHAVDRFDPEKGCKFSTYAGIVITQAIREALREKQSTIRIPDFRWSQLRQMQRAEQLFIQQHRRLPSAEELAEEADMMVNLVETLRGLYNLLDLCSLDRPLDRDASDELTFDPFSEEELTLGDLLFHSDDDTEEMALTNVSNGMLSSVLEETLPRREWLVLALRFGIADREHTLAEIGQRLNVTRERVRQIQERALRRLRRSPVLAKLSA
jgi:RNA polymerase sigma factor (sigma-70 family)